MNKLSVDGVLFDVDGTLLSSIDTMRDAWGNVCHDFGINIPFQDYAENIGIPFEDIMERLGLGNKASIIKKRYIHYSKISKTRPCLYDGVENMLEVLRASGKILGIVTSKPRASLDAVLSETCLGRFFDSSLVFTPDDGLPGKPNPAYGYRFLEKSGLTIKQVLYVGDMKDDKMFAKNLSVPYIHHVGGYYGRLSIEDFDDNIVIEIDAIKELMKNIL